MAESSIRPGATPRDSVSGSETELVTTESLLVHGRSEAGLALKPPPGAHNGASYRDLGGNLQASATGGDSTATRPAGIRLQGSDAARLNPKGMLDVPASVDQAHIKTVGRNKLDNSHVEIKSPGGLFFRLAIDDSGNVAAHRAPALAEPGRQPPTPRAILAPANVTLVMTSDPVRIVVL